MRLKTLPYSRQVVAWLSDNPDKFIRIVSGVDGQTLCTCTYDYELMELEQAFLGRKIDYKANVLLLPGNEDWSNFWWPLCDVSVIIDWSERSINDAHSFADFLLKAVKAKFVFIVHPKTGEYLNVKYQQRIAA